MLSVKAIAEVMHRPAMPATTTPEIANKVVITMANAPKASKFNSNHRFVIQKVNHI